MCLGARRSDFRQQQVVFCAELVPHEARLTQRFAQGGIGSAGLAQAGTHAGQLPCQALNLVPQRLVGFCCSGQARLCRRCSVQRALQLLLRGRSVSGVRLLLTQQRAEVVSPAGRRLATRAPQAGHELCKPGCLAAGPLQLPPQARDLRGGLRLRCSSDAPAGGELRCQRRIFCGKKRQRLPRLRRVRGAGAHGRPCNARCGSGCLGCLPVPLARVYTRGSQSAASPAADGRAAGRREGSACSGGSGRRARNSDGSGGAHASCQARPRPARLLLQRSESGVARCGG